MWVWSLGLGDPLEEGTEIHSSVLAWRIPRTEEPGGLWSMGWQRVGHDRSNAACLHTRGYFVPAQGKWSLPRVSSLTFTWWSDWVEGVMRQEERGGIWGRRGGTGVRERKRREAGQIRQCDQDGYQSLNTLILELTSHCFCHRNKPYLDQLTLKRKKTNGCHWGPFKRLPTTSCQTPHHGHT